MQSVKLLTERDVYLEYGLSVPWQRRRRIERRGPRFLKLGRMIRYRRDDLEAFLASCTVNTQKQKPDAELHQCTKT